MIENNFFSEISNNPLLCVDVSIDHEFKDHRNKVSSLLYFPPGILVTGSWDWEVHIYDSNRKIKLGVIEENGRICKLEKYTSNKFLVATNNPYGGHYVKGYQFSISNNNSVNIIPFFEFKLNNQILEMIYLKNSSINKNRIVCIIKNSPFPIIDIERKKIVGNIDEQRVEVDSRKSIFRDRFGSEIRVICSPTHPDCVLISTYSEEVKLDSGSPRNHIKLVDYNQNRVISSSMMGKQTIKGFVYSMASFNSGTLCVAAKVNNMFYFGRGVFHSFKFYCPPKSLVSVDGSRFLIFGCVDGTMGILDTKHCPGFHLTSKERKDRRIGVWKVHDGRILDIKVNVQNDFIQILSSSTDETVKISSIKINREKNRSDYKNFSNSNFYEIETFNNTKNEEKDEPEFHHEVSLLQRNSKKKEEEGEEEEEEEIGTNTVVNNFSEILKEVENLKEEKKQLAEVIRSNQEEYLRSKEGLHKIIHRLRNNAEKYESEIQNNSSRNDNRELVEQLRGEIMKFENTISECRKIILDKNMKISSLEDTLIHVKSQGEKEVKEAVEERKKFENICDEMRIELMKSKEASMELLRNNDSKLRKTIIDRNEEIMTLKTAFDNFRFERSLISMRFRDYEFVRDPKTNTLKILGGKNFGKPGVNGVTYHVRIFGRDLAMKIIVNFLAEKSKNIRDTYITPEFCFTLPLHKNLCRIHHAFVCELKKGDLSFIGWNKIFREEIRDRLLFSKTAIFIMPLYRCSFSSLLDQNRNIFRQEKYFLRFVKDILTWIKVLLSKKIVHRDIKPDNLFYDSQNRCFLIGDHGTCLDLSEEDYVIRRKYATSGSPYYFPPEILNAKENDKIRIDKWDLFSLGLLCYSIFSSFCPFTVQDIREEGYFRELEENECGSEFIRNFIKLLLEVSYEKRLSIDQFLEMIEKHFSEKEDELEGENDED